MIRNAGPDSVFLRNDDGGWTEIKGFMSIKMHARPMDVYVPSSATSMTFTPAWCWTRARDVDGYRSKFDCRCSVDLPIHLH